MRCPSVGPRRTQPCRDVPSVSQWVDRLSMHPVGRSVSRSVGPNLGFGLACPAARWIICVLRRGQRAPSVDGHRFFLLHLPDDFRPATVATEGVRHGRVAGLQGSGVLAHDTLLHRTKSFIGCLSKADTDLALTVSNPASRVWRQCSRDPFTDYMTVIRSISKCIPNSSKTGQFLYRLASNFNSYVKTALTRYLFIYLFYSIYLFPLMQWQQSMTINQRTLAKTTTMQQVMDNKAQ